MAVLPDRSGAGPGWPGVSMLIDHFPDDVNSAELPSISGTLVCQFVLLGQYIETSTLKFSVGIGVKGM